MDPELGKITELGEIGASVLRFDKNSKLLKNKGKVNCNINLGFLLLGCFNDDKKLVL